MHIEDRRILESWKEISAHLGHNSRTCQRWESELGLPIHRLDGTPKARVYAYADELDRWLEKRLHERGAVGMGLNGALEEVARRATGIEEAQPYPGLAAFTEADAEYFFGREAEVEEVWKRLPHRHLLALIGPSGAGKSSFLRAGLVPAKPEGWAHLVCTPGDAPFVALGQALVPEVSHDTVAMRQMLRFEDADVAVQLFRRWRGEHAEVLVIVDQLEELFTLNPPEVQARFASLLSRLTLEADVHVLLSMRDDFLLRCQKHEALRPVFEGIVPLGPPAGNALQRALVQPALKCGYRFEDEALVAEMLQTVEGERGALPLLAFAAASLWHSRDREGGLLTRVAHDAIGGVAGALARHAEATLDCVRADTLPLVRELFRNLVTAEGTRAVRDVEDLLTVFPEGRRADAEAVLRTLIEARLLTSYEAHGTEGGRISGRRVELVHESLLTAWPRLVRWRTEDEGGAQLRDQLRQVAHLWQEKGKPADLLWTGTSYQEYQVWRSRYPGGLSDAEESFGRAMDELAGRRRRRRQAAYAAVLTAVVLTATGLGFLLRKSVRETRRAEAETGQREAAQLLALGRLKFADYPNAALAYAIASLERSDNGPARRFAVEALWQGPPALILKDQFLYESDLNWSPDGSWFASNDARGLALFERGKSERRQLASSREGIVGFTSDSQRLLTRAAAGGRSVINVRLLPEGRIERTVEYSPATAPILVDDDRLLTVAFDTSAPKGEQPAVIRSLSLDGSTQKMIGRWEPHGLTDMGVDPSGTWIFSIQRGRLLQQRLDALSAQPRVLSAHEGDAKVYTRPRRDRVGTGDSRGEVHIWDTPSARLERTLKSPANAQRIALDPRGRFLAAAPMLPYIPPRSMFLFDLAAPGTAEPVPLLCPDADLVTQMLFSPDGSWFASVHSSIAILWNAAAKRSTIVGRQEPPGMGVAFTADGHLLSASLGRVLRRWPLSPAVGEDVRDLVSGSGSQYSEGLGLVGVDSGGRFAVVTRGVYAEVLVVPLDGSPPSVHQLRQRAEAHITEGILTSAGASLDPSGRFLAVYAPWLRKPELNGIRVLDLSTGDVRKLDTHAKGEDGCQAALLGGTDMWTGLGTPVWLRDGRLVSDGDAGLRVWDLATATSRLLRPCTKTSAPVMLLATPDSRTIVRLGLADATGTVSAVSVFDLAPGTTREITTHGNRVQSMALDPHGTILVTGDSDGVVRVGPLTGEEPHLLFGHTGLVSSVAVSPDGRLIASGSNDGTIRLWPMPDMTKPPLHTLPYDELLAKLKSLTNLRAVRDPASDTGWRIEIGPFPGWKDAPIW